MLRNIREMMKKISLVSLNVSDASQTLVASVEENTAATLEISKTMEQITAGASSQTELLEGNTVASTKFL